jgi:hypothetical protein
VRGAESLDAAVEQLSVRTVNPREPVHRRPRIVAADESMGVVIEMRSWDEVKFFAVHPSVWYDAFKVGDQIVKWIPWESLHVVFPMLPKDTIIVTIDDLGLVKMLSHIYSSAWLRRALCPDAFGEFQFSLSEEERDVDYRPDAPRITTTQHRVLHAGFKSTRKDTPNHWYRIVSAPKYLAASSLKDAQWSLVELLHFGQTAADFCRDSGVPLMASAGSTAARLLRLPRYYPTARRRVPRATNESARPALRGHPYKLYVEPMEAVTAVEFDQQSAHPHAASTIAMPSSNDLYAGFDFIGNRNPDVPTKPPTMLWRGSERFKVEIQRPGLFYLKLYGPTRHSEFSPWQTEGPFSEFVTSNEIEWLGELGIQVDGIVARWTSPTADEGIRAYAEDALEAGKTYEGFDRKVVKAIFLAGLGVLGARPNVIKVLRGHEITGGEEFTVATRSGPLTVYRKEMRSVYQLAIANLIQRAMIERECAKRSWQFATQLASEGWKVVCIYADSVFATPPTAQMPLTNLPEPWREKGVHTNLQFKTATTYVSDQAAKMPGVPRLGGDERLRWRRRLEASRVA